MEINGKKYILSKRRMREKYNLYDETKNLELPQEGMAITIEQIRNELIVRAKSISDSIYTTYLKMAWWKKTIYYFRYRRFKTEGAYYLYKHLDELDLSEAQKELEEIEGTDKKKSPVGRL